MSNKSLISNLLNDELRNIDINNHDQTQYNEQYRITNFNNNINDKYQTYLNRPQTIKENLGIVFNDDSIAQQSLPRTNDEKISHEGLNNLDIENKYIIISGEDRPWTISNNENTFNFQIDCGDISLINNNQSSSASIRHSLENVISISIGSILLPNRLLENHLRPSYFPFIQVQIDGIENTSLGTNKSLDRSLAVLIQKNTLAENLDDVRYTEFVNTNKLQKIFYTPKSRLNKLNLSILRHDGEHLINSSLLNNRDILDVKIIYYNNITEKLYIQTSTFFNPLNFQVGDIIKFKDYTFRESNLNFSECFQFNDFINRTEGHLILSTAKSSSDTDIVFDDLIEIDYPRTVNTSTGKYELDDWFSSLIDKTSIETTLEDDNTGKLLNTSLQAQIIMNVKILNKHSTRLIKNIKMF